VRQTRDTALDVARGLAVLSMVYVHLVPTEGATTFWGGIGALVARLLEGRPAALFCVLAGMAWATQAHRAGNSPGFPRYVARRVGALALAGAVFHYLGANECSVRPARLRGVRALAMGVSG
jgi:predicted acyltransferase